MAMSVGGGAGTGGEPEMMMEINTTPLIDVMLVLLVMLIITIPIQLHSVDLNLPAGKPPPALKEPEVIRIDVDFDGTILWNGTAVDRATLDSYLQSASTDDPQPEIHLQPNRLAKYDRVAMVLADAQRIGVTHIGFTGIENMQ